MKLSIVQGDILQDPGMIVIPVNLVPGVMGAGLAKQFADVCPKAKAKHADLVRWGGIKIGEPSMSYGLYSRPVIWFPTKRDWRDPSKLEWITKGLDCLSGLIHRIYECPWHRYSGGHTAEGMRQDGIAMPALGCGLGGLEWNPVAMAIRKFSVSLPDGWHVRLYRPHNSNE